MKLTEKQQEVYDHFHASDKGSITVLRGYAGSGKTTTAAHILKSCGNSRILVLAPTASALRVLRSKLNENEHLVFFTIAKIAKEPISYFEIFNKQFECSEEEMEQLREFLTKLGLPYDEMIDVFTFHSKVYGEVVDYGINYEQSEFLIRNRFGHQSKIKLEKKIKFENRNVETIGKILSAYDVVLIDESTMVSDDEMSLFVNALNQLGNKAPKMIIVGDPAQLSPVQGETNQFMQSQETTNAFTLDEVLRSEDDIVEFANKIRCGANLNIIHKMHSNVKMIPSEDIDHLATAFAKDLSECDMILSLRNDKVGILNEWKRIHKGANDAFSIGAPIVVNQNVGYEIFFKQFINGQRLTVLDRVSANEYERILYQEINNRKSELSNREITALKVAIETIKSYIIYNHIAMLITNDGPMLAIDVTKFSKLSKTVIQDVERQSKYIAMHLQYIENQHSIPSIDPILTNLPLCQIKLAYAMTIHKSQGSEWDNVCVVISDRDMYKKDSNLLYTAVTRAAKKLTVLYQKSW